MESSQNKDRLDNSQMPFKEVASSEIPEPKPVDVNFDKLDERPDGSKPRNLDRGVVICRDIK